MPEAEGSGVETLAVLAQLGLFMAVDGVAQDGMADVRHVDADLVGAAGFELAADVGIAPVAFDDLPVGHGVPGIALGDAHFLPVGGVPPDGGIHGAGVLPEGAADNALIGSGHGVVLELGGQPGVGVVVFRYGQQAGGILVDPVDDSGAKLAVDAGEVVPQRVHKPVDQGVVLVSRRRVNHQTLGLVDDQHVLVLVDDVQLHLGGPDIHRHRLGDLHHDGVAGLQTVIFPGIFAVFQHSPLFNELLGRAAAQLGSPGEKCVQPLAGGVSGKFHSFSS